MFYVIEKDRNVKGNENDRIHALCWGKGSVRIKKKIAGMDYENVQRTTCSMDNGRGLMEKSIRYEAGTLEPTM